MNTDENKPIWDRKLLLANIEIRTLRNAMRVVAGASGGTKRWTCEYESGHVIDCKYETADDLHDESAPYSWCLTDGSGKVLGWDWVKTMPEAVLAGVGRLMAIGRVT